MAKNVLTTSSRKFLKALIGQHLLPSRNHLTPELPLFLITPECHLWRSHPDQCPFDDPFWAFYWPGGQALTRYILDHPNIVKDQRVLDIGCGCGSVSIAAKLCGAKHVLANDVDQAATIATELNMEANSTCVETDTRNLLSRHKPEEADIIFMGDMFYDPSFASVITKWLSRLSPETNVYIGDPGRLAFNTNPLKESLQCLAEYKLGESVQMENNGLTSAGVWQLCRR